MFDSTHGTRRSKSETMDLTALNLKQKFTNYNIYQLFALNNGTFFHRITTSKGHFTKHQHEICRKRITSKMNTRKIKL